MNERRAAALTMAAVAALSFFAYWSTACRTIYWGDGIELTAVSAILGVAHPTGYPLFSLLGKIFAQVPIGTIAFRLNLMSALTGSILAALVAAILWRLLPVLTTVERDRLVVRASLSAAAGLTVAFSQTIWYHAGLTEVYLLSAAIFAGVVLVALNAVETRSIRLFLAAVFLTGVGACNHAAIAFVLFPALALLGVWLLIPPAEPVKRGKRRLAAPREALSVRLGRLGLPAILLVFAGLSAYLYMPLRAAKQPRLNWGNPSTVKNFLWSVRGGEFRRFYMLKVPMWLVAEHGRELSPQALSRIRQGTPFDAETYSVFFRARLSQWLDWNGAQIAGFPSSASGLRLIAGFAFLAVGLLGLLIVVRRLRAFGAFLGIAVLANLAFTFMYSIIDIEGYYFPAHVVFVLGAFVVFAELHALAEEQLLARPSNLLAALLIAVPAVAFFQNRSYCDRSDYDAAEKLGRQVLAQLKPDAMILTHGDYDIEPLWYQQVVERRRRDVVAFGANFLATPGYARYFEKYYDPPVEARYFKSTPESVEPFATAMNYTIEQNSKHRPIYTTTDQPWLDIPLDPIEIPVMKDLKTIDVPERRYLPGQQIYRLRIPKDVQ